MSTDTWLMLAEGAVALLLIYLGARMGGIGLGVWGLVGVFILVFAFGLDPGSPPIDVILIILAVVLASATMQTAGGIDWFVAVATRLIQRHPKRVTLVAPVVSCLFTMGAGTGNVYYPLIPVIADVSAANGVRPERPLSVASVASQMGVAASPVSAAGAVMVALMEPLGFDLQKILAIVVPATFVGIFVASVAMLRWGDELVDDPMYQRRVASGQLDVEALTAAAAKPPADVPRAAARSAWIFLLALAAIVAFGLFSGLRPDVSDGVGGTRPLSMTVTIQLVMALAAALMLLTCRINAKDVTKASIWSAGLVAIVSLFGLAWMADTFIQANEDLIVGGLSSMTENVPWLFALALFVVAALTTSQSGATRAIMPVGISLGIQAQYLVAMWPSVIGIYFFPVNGSQLSAVELDRTGTTKIGRGIVNHSFMIPTLVAWVVSVLVGAGIGLVFYGLF